MFPKSNSQSNNLEEVSYNNTLACQKWNPIEIESEDEDRFLPSDLLVDSNLGHGKEKSRRQPQQVGILFRYQLLIDLISFFVIRY